MERFCVIVVLRIASFSNDSDDLHLRSESLKQRAGQPPIWIVRGLPGCGYSAFRTGPMVTLGMKAVCSEMFWITPSEGSVIRFIRRSSTSLG